jgi:hypothetical protein
MDAPLYPLGLLSDAAALAWAVPLGAAFGVLLERAGFGDPRRVVGQFYGTDLRVLKMMFTALVTAMIGALTLAHLGILDLDLVQIPPTRLVANALGGLLLGFGFITAGFCPGTALVGSAGLRSDAWWCVAGLAVGVMLFAIMDPALSPIMHEAAATRSTLPQALGWPIGSVVLAVTLLAIGAFVVAEVVEIRLGGLPRAGQALLTGADRQRSRAIVGSLLAAAALLAWAGDPLPRARGTVATAALAHLMEQAPPTVSVESLADGLMDGSMTARLIDVSTTVPQVAVPRVEHLPVAALGDLACARTAPILLIAQDPRDAVRAWVVLTARGIKQVSVVEGGLTAWNERILQPILLPVSAGQDPQAAAADIALRLRRCRHFGGSPRFSDQTLSPPTSPPPATPPLPQHKTPRPAVVPGGC